MRTTIDIEDDVLNAAKEIAAREGTTAGKVLSALARQGLRGSKTGGSQKSRKGIPILPSRGDVITLDRIQGIRDEEGL